MNPFTPQPQDVIVYRVSEVGTAEIAGIAQNGDELEFLIEYVSGTPEVMSLEEAFDFWGETALRRLLDDYRRRIFRPGTLYFFRERIKELEFRLVPAAQGETTALGTERSESLGIIDTSDKANRQYAVLLASAPELYRAISTLLACQGQGIEREREASERATKLLNEINEALFFDLP